MALTVGTDTYISATDAKTYITNNYLPSDPSMSAWAVLSDANIEVLLRQALAHIERMHFIGIKAVSTQALEFPRAIRSPYTANLPTGYSWLAQDYVVQTEVPTAVKNAQVEEAYALIGGASSRQRAQRQGVKSISIGNVSETYSGAPLSLQSYTAKELLRPYLAGSVVIE